MVRNNNRWTLCGCWIYLLAYCIMQKYIIGNSFTNKHTKIINAEYPFVIKLILGALIKMPIFYRPITKRNHAFLKFFIQMCMYNFYILEKAVLKMNLKTVFLIIVTPTFRVWLLPRFLFLSNGKRLKLLTWIKQYTW